ncbi:hypothetical protein SCUCBS95973_005043 [Sporothrix curviconia]|uniref:Uncharacterized protein n=1 Tax=Sporothrix curviconia TaxID=1260050 RepID=A0ABP0BVE9_9PEZI
MSQTMALNRALTLTVDTGVGRNCYTLPFEWYTERGGMQYSDSTASESESDDKHTQDQHLHDRDDNGQLGDAMYAADDTTYTHVYAYRPWPQSSTDEQSTTDDDDDNDGYNHYTNIYDNDDTMPSTATIDADTQIVYQTNNNDLSYYGYGDYDFAQLSRTTTAYSVPSTEVMADRGAEDEEEDAGEDCDDDNDNEEEDEDDLIMAQRRWHCPRLER